MMRIYQLSNNCRKRIYYSFFGTGKCQPRLNHAPIPNYVIESRNPASNWPIHNHVTKQPQLGGKYNRLWRFITNRNEKLEKAVEEA